MENEHRKNKEIILALVKKDRISRSKMTSFVRFEKFPSKSPFLFEIVIFIQNRFFFKSRFLFQNRQFRSKSSFSVFFIEIDTFYPIKIYLYIVIFDENRPKSTLFDPKWQKMKRPWIVMLRLVKQVLLWLVIKQDRTYRSF